MAVDITSFRIRFPEFSDPVEYLDARIQIFLDDAVNAYMGTNEGRWCGKYDYAHAYLVAHLLTVGTKSELGDNSTATGLISSKSAGGVSVTKTVPTKTRTDLDDFYMSTSYGQRFLTIRNTCFAGVSVANCL